MKKAFLILLTLLFVLSSCSKDAENSSNKYASIEFFNESSYRVDIYRYLNPADYDPDLLVTSIDSGKTKTVSVIESSDQDIGDVFYIRYNILLADSIETGQDNFYIQAERDMSNLAFVVKGGESYLKKIEQPANNQLSFCNTYLKVVNTTSYNFKILNGTSYLSRMGDKSYWVNSSAVNWYEIPLKWPMNKYNMTQLHFQKDGVYMNPQEFEMEKGYIYIITINNDSFKLETKALSIQ